MAAGYGMMAATTNTARDAPALLDPEPEPRGGHGIGRHARVTSDEIRSYHRIARVLLETAARARRKQAAAAAVEVFRSALEDASDDASFRNGLGAALLERARLESNSESLAT